MSAQLKAGQRYRLVKEGGVVKFRAYETNDEIPVPEDVAQHGGTERSYLDQLGERDGLCTKRVRFKTDEFDIIKIENKPRVEEERVA